MIIECGITIKEVSLAGNSVAVKISISKLADIDLEYLLALVFHASCDPTYSILIAVEA
jgi:hypothetical protein